MAVSRFQTTQYTAENFVESAGAILFHRSARRVCLVHHQEKDEWLLAKGRRNVGEALPQTAIREVTEETGFACRLLPVTLTTRAPPAIETGRYLDETRVHSHVCEPFMMTCRQLTGGQDLKIIMWYIAEVDEAVARMDTDDTFNIELVEFDDGLATLTYQLDRDILQQAIKIFQASYGP